MKSFCKYVIVGGGIAASSCADELIAFVAPTDSVIMISLSSDIKVATSSIRLSRVLDELVIKTVNSQNIYKTFQNFTFIRDLVIKIDDLNKNLICQSGKTVPFDKLILCIGSSPKNIFLEHPLIYTLRDFDSVQSFKERLSTSSSICIVGNGGIAMELAFEITNCIVHWVIRQDHIGSRFFDEETSKFFQQIKCQSSFERKNKMKIYVRNNFFNDDKDSKISDIRGGAVGPDWSRDFSLKGLNDKAPPFPDNLILYFNSEVESFVNADNGGLCIKTSKGSIFECDFMVLAVGVDPNSALAQTTSKKIKLNDEGAIIVNNRMKTNVYDIFASGDCASVNFNNNLVYNPRLWFQMSLWTQAKYMGTYVARCAMDQEQQIPIQFDLFGHVTRFFGFKVCLLGLYNGQGLEKELLTFRHRIDQKSFIRIIAYQNRIIGAILIGETDLEETFENLILSQLNVSSILDEILNPDIDISDYFD